MASLLDVLKDLPSEIRYDIFVKVFDEVTETGQGVPSILPALRGERKLYFEALSIYYSLTTIRLSHGNLPTFLTLSQPTKDLVRKICLDISLDDPIYHPQGRQPSPPMEVLEAASKAHNLEEIHLIPRLRMLDPQPQTQSQAHSSSQQFPTPPDAEFNNLMWYLSLLASGQSFNLKESEKMIRGILSKFYELKLDIVQQVLTAFPKLRRLVVEPRLEGFVYFPDSFVRAVNCWLGIGRLVSVKTGKRGESEQWMWDLRGRRRIVRYED